MSDILIRGMEMPHDCDECKLCAFIPIGEYDLYRKCMPLNRNAEITIRRKDCPLIEVPTREEGMWIDEQDKDEFYGSIYKCSVCGNLAIDAPAYCSSCGAKMEVIIDG